MNLANPFQTIRHEDRRDVQRVLKMVPPEELRKSTLASMKIAAGIEVGQVIEEFDEAPVTVDEMIGGYRRCMRESLHQLAYKIIEAGKGRMLDITDEEALALVPFLGAAYEVTQNYVRLVAVSKGVRVELNDEAEG